MSDWRLNGQEEYLADETLYKVTFPDFWKNAYAQKNGFYQKIRNYAVKLVEEEHRWEEYLEGERIGKFWHQHCNFCWEKATTDEAGTFYCTDDMYHWVCEECFHDFREQFNWTVKSAEELPICLPSNSSDPIAPNSSLAMGFKKE